MADLKERPGALEPFPRHAFDEGDGTYAVGVAALLHEWNGLTWVKYTGPAGQIATTAVVTSVASSATVVTLKALNASRLGLAIMNDSTQILYVKFGSTATSSDYTVKMVAGAYYEIPFNYTGIVTGIWASANGAALVTEVTA